MKSISKIIALTLFAVAMTVTAQKDSPSGGTNDVTQTGGAVTNDIGQVDTGSTNAPALTAPRPRVGVTRPQTLGSQPVTLNFPVSDADIASGWRVVSVTSNGWDGASFSISNFPCARVWETARDCGAGFGHWRIPVDGWRFPFGPSLWTNGFLWVEGVFRPRFADRTDEIAILNERLTLCPSANWSRYGLEASRCWCATNGADGLVATFEGAAVGDDPAKIAHAQMELFPRDGTVALRYDLRRVGEAQYLAGVVAGGTNHFVTVGSNTSEVVFRRVHPDDWDMDGLPNGIDPEPRVAGTNVVWNQSADWARAAFPSNADAIASVGYAAWAANRAADPDRHLVGFTIASAKGAWPVCFRLGDRAVMCDGTEELRFAIDCGTRYPFALSDGELAVLALYRPQGTFRESGPIWTYPSERWLGDLRVHYESPRTGWICREPQVALEGTPHLFPGTDETLSVSVTNCHADAFLGCTWTGGAGISFADPHALTTTVRWESSATVPWTTNGVSLVTSYAGGYEITNSFMVTVGTQSNPTPTLRVSCQKIQFVNDGTGEYDRPERVYEVTVGLLAAREQHGTLTFSGGGSTGTQFWHDWARTRPVTAADPLVMPSGGFMRTVSCYMTSTVLGSETVTATLNLAEGGGSCTDTAAFQVIEPLRRLVTTEKYENRFVNPSRLVRGTNAILKVSANVGGGPALGETNVVWSVVRGPGRIAETRFANGNWYAFVEPTATNGEVEVEALFNSDWIQPSFVLPIVEPRTIPVKAFVVEPPIWTGQAAWTDGEIRSLFTFANENFAQVGISFDLQSITHNAGTESDWSVAVFDGGVDVGASIDTVTNLSAQISHLLLSLSATNALKVVFTGEINSRDTIAFWTEYGIIIDKRANGRVMSHELGHALGLDDIYPVVRKKINNLVYTYNMTNRNAPVTVRSFQSGQGDWGTENGRGFYEMTDTVTNVIERLLMCGQIRNSEFGDVPGGMVWGLSPDGNVQRRPVGAANLTTDIRKVYSQ